MEEIDKHGLKEKKHTEKGNICLGEAVIRSVCVCPLPALLKIELGCTDCHTHADMLSLKLYLPGSETARFPYMNDASPPSDGTERSCGQEGTTVVTRDLPEHPLEINGVRSTGVGKIHFWKVLETI